MRKFNNDFQISFEELPPCPQNLASDLVLEYQDVSYENYEILSEAVRRKDNIPGKDQKNSSVLKKSIFMSHL